jgi:hypothetical protein
MQPFENAAKKRVQLITDGKSKEIFADGKTYYATLLSPTRVEFIAHVIVDI